MSPESFVHYKSGHKVIDGQHWGLFELLSKAKFEKDHSKNSAMSYLRELAKVLEQHFKYEEELMIKIDYPFRKFHISQHQKMASDLNDQIKETQRSQIGFSIYFFARVEQALLKHIDSFDLQFVEYIHNLEKRFDD